MRIRNYEDKDYDQFRDLLINIGAYYDHLDTRKNFREKSKEDSDSIIVAEDNGKLVGCCTYSGDPWMMHIFHFGTHSEFRRMGIGTKVLDEMERRIQEKGIRSVGLYVKPENKEAIAFYKKRNWGEFDTYICMEKNF